MNQILYTIENKEDKNKLNNITIFFAIAIIIFGILMASMGGYRIVSAKIQKEEAIEAAKVPSVKLNAESNHVIISVKHSKEIKDIIYSWNDGEETVLSKNTTDDIEEYIDVPAGTNTLKVTVYDIDGKNTTETKEFTYEGTYMDVSIIENKSLKIVVTDMAGLQSVTYNWNSDEGVTAYPDEDDLTKIEIVTDIPSGLNTIKVNAVNRNNITQSKEVNVKGVTKPTMKISYNADKTRLKMKLNDDQGIQTYSYTLSNAPLKDVVENGQIIEEFKDKIQVVEQQSKPGNGETSIEDEVPFNSGFNYLEVTITNVDGAEETFTGWCAK